MCTYGKTWVTRCAEEPERRALVDLSCPVVCAAQILLKCAGLFIATMAMWNYSDILSSAAPLWKLAVLVSLIGIYAC